MRPIESIAGWAKSSLRSVFDDLVTTAFPSDCRVCNGPLLGFSTLPICERCEAAIHEQTGSMCRLCGEALDIDMESVRFAGQAGELPSEGLLCTPCRVAPPMFERAVAYAEYRDELREMVHLLKYERMRGVAGLLGGMLAQAILTLRADTQRELIVVAVPLFPAKQRQRGYNQAELLADAAIAELGHVAPDWKLRRLEGVLTRRRDTNSQFELTPHGRRRNVEGAFEIDASGLRRAGARKVWVATLARAQTPRVALWDDAGMRTAQGFG
jgi:predicted amidophosphoribosyltransferase